MLVWVGSVCWERSVASLWRKAESVKACENQLNGCERSVASNAGDAWTVTRDACAHAGGTHGHVASLLRLARVGMRSGVGVGGPRVLGAVCGVAVAEGREWEGV